MKIAVIGAGGVGGYFGGRLCEAGNEVTFIVRGQHLAAIREHGLRVDSIGGDFHVRPSATDNPSEVGTVDAIVVTTKAWQIPEVVTQVNPMVGGDTMILTLQNGVEAPYHFLREYKPEQVFGGLCRIISSITAPGHISHTAVNPPYVMFGSMGDSTANRGGELIALLKAAKVDAHIADDIEVALWQKFLLIAPWSGIGAVTNLTLDQICKNPETRELISGAMSEILAVAHAKNIAVPDDAVAATLDFFDGVKPGGTASMQRDILAGRPSELEDQVGVVVRLGRELGVLTPINSFVYSCLAPRERLHRTAKP